MVSNYENVVAADFISNIEPDQLAHRTNMKFTKKKKTEQQFLMHGPKFFDETLKILVKNSELKEFALPASALATYILLHYKVDDLGVLTRNFKLKELEMMSGIPYSTIHTGFKVLQDEGWVEEILIKGMPHYKICNYNRLNSTAQESIDKTHILSYFRVPHHLLETSILKELVTHRDNKGIIQLLKLCNSFTRGIDKYHNQYSIEEFSLTRLMKGLKEKLNRNAKKVRQYLDIITPIFNFEVVSQEERKPDENREAKRIRTKIKQLVITSFKVTMNPACVVVNDRAKFRQSEAKMRKEAISRLTTAQISLTDKDRKDITVAYRNEITKIAACIYNTKLQKNFMSYSMTYALDHLEEYIAKTKKKVKSIGGFIRAKLRESLTDWSKHHLDDDTRHLLIMNLVSNDIKVPDAFTSN